MTAEGFKNFLVFVPALLVGQWLGARGFRSADAAAFRRRVLGLLFVLAVLTGVQRTVEMFRAP